MQSRTLALTLLLLAAGTLAACSNLRFPGVYRIDIEQGNLVDADMLEKLRPGMSPEQVRYVMGNPLLVDPFEPGRWVYPYRLRLGSGEVVSSRVVLQFEGEVLQRWEGEPVPATARRPVAAAAAATPAEVPAAEPLD
jgi:outer membrane protein assembly factor BamE